MKYILIILSILYCSAYAQTGIWNLSYVRSSNAEAVGYIYHTTALGIQSNRTTKINTSLRFICSVAPDKEHIIALYWEGLTGNITQLLDIKIDGKSIGPGQLRWEQDGALLYRKVQDSQTLIQAIITGRTISISWAGTDGVTRMTVFDLRTFNSDYSKYQALCK